MSRSTPRRTGGEIAVESVRAARAKFGALPRGKAAQKLGLVLQGIVPDGYKTIAQRKKEKAAAAKKAAAEKAAHGKQAKPPPDAAAA